MVKKLQVKSLIQDIKPKDPRLHQILEMLIDMNTTVEASTIDRINNAVGSIVIPAGNFVTQAQLIDLTAQFLDHSDRHISGGDDAFLLTNLLEALVKRVRTLGDIDLEFSTVNDHEVLVRDGLTITTTPFILPLTDGDPLDPQIIYSDGDFVYAEVEVPF